jgi:hypothetical protein
MRNPSRLLLALILLAGLAAPAWAQTQSAERPNAIAIDSGTKTATAVAGAATLAKNSGIITSEALVTAAGATYTLTVTDSVVTASDTIFASVWYGTATTGTPTVTICKPAAGSFQVIIQNISAATPLNGTLKIGFFALKS